MDASKFHCTPSWDMHLNINRHECTQLYYAEWNENNKFRDNFRKSKNKVLNDCTNVFKRVNGEGLAMIRCSAYMVFGSIDLVQY